MQNFYLNDYLREYFNLPEDIYDAIRYTLDSRIYSYGNHFRYHYESVAGKGGLRTRLGNLKRGTGIWLKSFLKSPAQNRKRIISNAYFSVNLELKNSGYEVFHPYWDYYNYGKALINPGLYQTTLEYNRLFKTANLSDLFQPAFTEKVRALIVRVSQFYSAQDAGALFVPNDMSFFENTAIQAFRKIGKPSFVFLHGLPGRYNNRDDNRADYLIVWGDKIRDLYVSAGVPREKIFVSGHPAYSRIKPSGIRSSTDDVLVITKSMNGAQIDTGNCVLSDRGNLAFYLYSVQRVLEKAGVKHARFRPHPSENPDWYMKMIDGNFYRPDRENLADSIGRSTLVIGPTSTVFLEAFSRGKNYLIYEPSVDGADLINYRLVPPFDGSDKRIPAAKNEEELLHYIKTGATADSSFWNDYVRTPFDLSFIKKIV